MTELSRELNLVIPVSFFERARYLRYNSVAILDCGSFLGVYRKTHIPDDHFYQEKFYFLQEIQALKYLKLLSEKSA